MRLEMDPMRYVRMSDDGKIGDGIRLCPMIMFTIEGAIIFVVIWLFLCFFVTCIMS